EEHLQVIPSELEIVKQDFEKKSLELEKRIEKLEEGKVQRGLDVNVQKQEIQEEKIKANQCGKKFQDARVREDALKKDLLESRNEKVGLRAQVAKLERSLHQHRSRNSVIELKASLTKIEELKGKIEELEDALQNCELRVELFEMNNERWKEHLECSQGQIKHRDHIMGEALT
ncbi:hypothetical protein Gogos_021930, partial [Gossypium gossypioides]|nr:hypothetical protein [Gossypium gossypioides]